MLRWPARGSRLVRSAIAASALAGLGAVVMTGALTPSSDANRAPRGLRAAPPSLPAAARAAFTIPTPKRLDRAAGLTWWAPVRAATAVRPSPSRRRTPVSFLRTLTPEGTANLVVVVGQGRWRAGEEWLRVRLAVLPANRTGWVPRRALGAYQAVSTRLVIDRALRTATLFDAGRAVFHAKVGVGRPQSPTPRGHFYIRNKLTEYRSAFYGPVAFGTSARSAILTDWPAGGFIGLHGTNQPALIPGAVSHGCVRFTDPDIARLARLMPVGTPLTIA